MPLQIRVAGKQVSNPALGYSVQLTHGFLLTLLDEAPRPLTIAFYDVQARCVEKTCWPQVARLLARLLELRRQPIRATVAVDGGMPLTASAVSLGGASVLGASGEAGSSSSGLASTAAASVIGRRRGDLPVVAEADTEGDDVASGVCSEAAGRPPRQRINQHGGGSSGKDRSARNRGQPVSSGSAKPGHGSGKARGGSGGIHASNGSAAEAGFTDTVTLLRAEMESEYRRQEQVRMGREGGTVASWRLSALHGIEFSCVLLF